MEKAAHEFGNCGPDIVYLAMIDRAAVLAAYDDWARDRHWALRLPILGFLLLASWGILTDVTHGWMYWGINLGIHEAGHLLTRFTFQFLCAIMGSVLQCAVPIFALFYLLRQDTKFALPICLNWLASNVLYVSWYMRDAVERQGVLLSVGGGEAYHDWEYIFGELGLMAHAITLSRLVYGLGFLILGASVVSCALMMRRMRAVNLATTPRP